MEVEQVFDLESPPENKAKNAPKTFEFKGKTYKSGSELAVAFGIDDRTLMRRLNDGWSIEEALEIVERDFKNKPQELLVEGKLFASRNEAARHYGLNIATVATRVVRRGWSIEQALELVPPPEGFHTDFGAVYQILNRRNNKRYVGITLHNPPAKRLEQHVRSSKVAKERREGSIAEAIHVFGEKNFDFTVLDTAKTQRVLQELEKRYIAKLNTLKPNGYNLSEGGSIGRVPGRSVEIKSLGLKFKTVAEAARYFGIQASALLFRLDKGYSPEQSVGLEPLSWTSPRWDSR